MIGMPVIFKLLTPKVVNAIIDYVFKPNNLDEQMEIMQERMKKVEGMAHHPKEFIVCKDCKNKAKRSI
jgi:hypothetical protein